MLAERDALEQASAVLSGLQRRRAELTAKLNDLRQQQSVARMRVAELVMAGNDAPPPMPVTEAVAGIELALATLDKSIADAEQSVVVARGRLRAAGLQVAKSVREDAIQEAIAAAEALERALARSLCFDNLLGAVLAPGLSPQILSTGFAIPLIGISQPDRDGSTSTTNACRIRDTLAPKMMSEARAELLAALGGSLPW